MFDEVSNAVTIRNCILIGKVRRSLHVCSRVTKIAILEFLQYRKRKLVVTLPTGSCNRGLILSKV